jgi:hypothetical protein
MLDPQLLVDYMSRFVGFGDPSTPVWFVGLEQGGGEDLAELERRLVAWRDSGAGSFADLQEHCVRIGERRWHGAAPRIQPTLGKLVRLVLASQGQRIDPESVRRHQAEKFGSMPGGSVMAELMPLPSRNISQWIYSSLTDVPGLESREAYLRRYRPVRLALLQRAIRDAAPRAVVFVGTSETETWSEVAGQSFVQGHGGASWCEVGPTRFVVLTHPTAYGAKNAYFEEIGRALTA